MTETAVNLEELVASERDRVLRFCRSKIRDKAAAEDVTQEVFVKFAQEMANSAKPIREPKAWLTRVAENACADYGRRLVKRLKGRRPKRKLPNDSPAKPPRQAIVLYESELPQSSEIHSDDDVNLDPFSKAIDQAAMDRPNEEYSAEYEELSIPQYHLLLSQLNRRERFAFLVCGPWHLSESDASVFLGSKLAKILVTERGKWPTGISIVEASRLFNIKEGTLSSQISRATAKLRSKLAHLKTVRPTPSEQRSDRKLQVMSLEPAAEPVIDPPVATSPASPAFARIIVGEPSGVLPGWAGAPPARSAELPNREFSQIDQREALRTISYRCGSYLKGCMTCGDVRYAGKCKECGTEIHSTEERPTAACEGTSCRERPMVKWRKYYTSGCSVRKAYSPKAAGWTYWCYLCGARDENCWEGFVGERGLEKTMSDGNARKCSRILQLLKVAERPEDMEIAGLHFHGVKGDTKRWSLCATGNDRITFGWVDEELADVYFEDYQQGGSKIMEGKSARPVHPGAIIKHDILPAVQLSVTAAAKALGVSPKTLQEILKKRKPLPTIMCLKVSRLFGSSPEVWMRLQAAYDLKTMQQNKKVMERVARIVPVKAPLLPVTSISHQAQSQREPTQE